MVLLHPKPSKSGWEAGELSEEAALELSSSRAQDLCRMEQQREKGSLQRDSAQSQRLDKVGLQGVAGEEKRGSDCKAP